MSELTLDALKAEHAEADTAREEANRVTRKRLALEHLLATETRLGAYVGRIKERRKALKAELAVADAFARSIEAFSDDEDATAEEIEQLVHSINESFPPSSQNGCAAAPAPAPVSKGDTVNISIEKLDVMIADAIRENVSPSVIRRGSRAARAG